MSRLIVTGTKALVNKFRTTVDFTDIPSQWTMGYVELRVKLTNQSHLVIKVKQKKTELHFHKETIPHRLFYNGQIFSH